MFCLRGWLFLRRNGIHYCNHCSSRRGLCAFDSSAFEQLSNRFQRCLFAFVYHPPGEGRVQFDRFCLVTSGLSLSREPTGKKQQNKSDFLPTKYPTCHPSSSGRSLPPGQGQRRRRRQRRCCGRRRRQRRKRSRRGHLGGVMVETSLVRPETENSQLQTSQARYGRGSSATGTGKVQVLDWLAELFNLKSLRVPLRIYGVLMSISTILKNPD